MINTKGHAATVAENERLSRLVHALKFEAKLLRKAWVRPRAALKKMYGGDPIAFARGSYLKDIVLLDGKGRRE